MSSLASSWATTMNLCGRPACCDQGVLREVFDGSTCVNHLVETGIVAPLAVALLLRLLVRLSESRPSSARRRLLRLSSPLHLATVLFNGCLGLFHLVLGLWMLLGSNFSSQDASRTYLPHWWLVTLSQGFSLVLAGFAFAAGSRFLGQVFARLWSVSLTVYATFVCGSSVVAIVAEKAVTVKACLDLLSLPGAVMFLIYSIQSSHDEEGHEDEGLYKPLKTADTADSEGVAADSSESTHQKVTPFARAGILSQMAFWWLNPLMKTGYEKPLDDRDMPLLGAADRAQSQYSMFLEKLNNKKQTSHDATPPSILWAIVSHHKCGIMVSGLFALLKVLTLSIGPLLLRAFINLSTGKVTSDSKHEGYMLAALMFICKCCESLSQRQGRTYVDGCGGSCPHLIFPSAHSRSTCYAMCPHSAQ